MDILEPATGATPMFRRKPWYDAPMYGIGPTDGWKSIPINECGEPLVALGPFSDYPDVATDAVYWGQSPNTSPYRRGQLEGTLLTVFVREWVAKRLRSANTLLPPRHMLLVWDGYRPLSVQHGLYTHHVGRRVGQGESQDFVKVDAQRFVSIPSDDPSRPPPHNTGVAVDLTIIRFSRQDWKRMEMLTRLVMEPESYSDVQTLFTAEMERQELIRRAKPLKMGTVFDAVQPETAARHYEGRRLWPWQYKVRRNRRMLHHVMAQSGLQAYGEEWWHFDALDSQFSLARIRHVGRGAAMYGPATLSPE
ncbi:MAG: M15 family metallopeptidase, partial [Patescibacteria group bacterium]